MGIFLKEHMQKLLHNKFIILIGDSVQRSIYKDLLVLWHENRLITDPELRKKGEKSFLDDKLIDRSELTNGIGYREVREFKTDHVLIRFYFATRIYNDYIESVLKQYEDDDQPIPDVVLLNSCLWDISRYGQKGWGEYQKNIEKFCSRLDDIVPVETCIIWRTTLPVSQSARGGFLTDEIARNASTLVVDVFLANHLAHAVVTKHKYDVIDMHYLFTEQQQRRAKDGIHWNMFAHRRMTNILLTHISQAWGLGEPAKRQDDDTTTDFNRTDLSMNTTEVLKSTYTPMPARQLTATEERYGGPIRSSGEMYQMYNSYYAFPVVKETANQPREDVLRFEMTMNQQPVPAHEPTEDYWSSHQSLTNHHHFPSLPDMGAPYHPHYRRAQLSSHGNVNGNFNVNNPTALGSYPSRYRYPHHPHPSRKPYFRRTDERFHPY